MVPIRESLFLTSRTALNLFDSLVKEVVDTYGEITPDQPCSWALMSDDESMSDVTKLFVCHAHLLEAKAGIYDQLITSFPVTDDIHLKFFDFMKNVLYRNWSEHFLLKKYHPTDDTKKTAEGQYYIHITNLSKIPANVLYNFCICSRAIVEQKQLLENWDKFVSEGIDPIFAFVVVHCEMGWSRTNTIVCDLDTKISSVTWYDGHWPFDYTLDLAVILEAKPIKLSKSFKSSPASCRPTNCIWGEAKNLRKLEGLTVREFWEIWKHRAT